MEHSLSELFVILALSPEKGRVSIDSIHFRYSLTGAILMDFLDGEEFKVEDRRVIPSLRINDDAIHQLFAERIMKSSRNRKISYWIRRLTIKSRFIFSEMMKALEKKRILRIEEKKFLNIFPYKRYWFIDNSVRNNIIELLRGILLYGKKPGKREIMLLGILEASRAYSLLSRERGDAKILRKKNSELLKGDALSAEISQAIREVQSAIVASVTAAAVAAHGSH
jgi:golgi phosphoprotein 3